MKNYSYSVFWNEGDGGYIGTCLEFPEQSAFGETPEEALAELKIALQLAIEVCEAEGIPVPEPRVQLGYSGQFRTRLPKSLHAKLVEQAEIEGVSLNQLITTYLSEALGRKRGVASTLAAHEYAVRGIVEGMQILSLEVAGLRNSVSRLERSASVSPSVREDLAFVAALTRNPAAGLDSEVVKVRMRGGPQASDVAKFSSLVEKYIPTQRNRQ